MKKSQIKFRRLVGVSLFIIGYTIQLQAQTQEPFVTTWNTEAGTGQTGNTTIVLPITSGAYDVDINNDGTFEMTNQTGNTTIDFGTGNAGTHTIAIRPNAANTNNLLRIDHFATGSTPQKLTSIDKWGDIVWSSMQNAFSTCANMTLADDAGVPDLTMVTSMVNMFFLATSFNGDLSAWNVSNVTRMLWTFRGATSFNQDISSWNVANVNDMSKMFNEATSFNQDISSWNVSNVTDMENMLTNANSFSSENYDALLTGWSNLPSLQDDVTFGAPPTTYCSGKAGRDILENTYNWNISGDSGEGCPPFVTTWEVATGDLTITIPTTNTLTYNYTVDWGDSTTDTTTYTGDATHTYQTAGTYTVAISGDFPAIYFNNRSPQAGDNSLKIKTIKSWGTQRWGTLATAFQGCQNLTTIEDGAGVPDLTMVTDMRSTFDHATSFNGDLSSWDVSNVTNMGGTFINASSFTSDLSSWNVSNVVEMWKTFEGANSFNSDLSSWNVSNVNDMERTFFGTTSFNQDLSSWDVSNVNNMAATFAGASSFTTDLSSWNVSKVTRMWFTFFAATSFNGDLSSWDVSNVTTMQSMFDEATSFNNDLSSWNVSNVTIMQNMFGGATSFSSKNYDALLTGWSNLPSLQDDVTFGAPPTTYCRGKAGRDILENTYNWAITGDSGEDCSAPFVTTWNTEEGTGQTGNTTIVLPIVSGAYDVDINNDGTFEMTNQTGSTTIDFGTGNAGTHTIAVRPNAANADNQLRINHSAIGSTPQKLTSIDKWGDIAWTSMAGAFQNCSNMTIADDAGVPDLTTVTSMNSMFFEATNFNSDLSSWDVSKVSTMQNTFWGATSFNQDLSSWNVSNVIYMSMTFESATSFNGDLSTWDVSKVTIMQNTFRNATSFNGDLSSWNVSNVTSMQNMFNGATSFSSKNYDALLTGWSSLPSLQNNVDFGAPPTTYCRGKAGRDILENTYNWAITGDLGEDCPIPFVTTWNTEEGTGQTGNTTIVLPIVSGAYDVDINNDGTFEMTNQTGSTTIDFGTGNAGTHTIAVIPNPADINGQLRINHSATGSTPQKLTSIDKWGNTAWTSMAGAFHSCSNMTIADDAGAPDLTMVTSMGSMFFKATNFNSDLSSWNVSKVTTMQNTFLGATSFNQDLSSWDVSKVTTMNNTFRRATSFNQDLSSWNVSNVIYMSMTFESATSFNGDLSTWDVSKVTIMQNTFRNATSFNGDLSSWNVSNVTSMQNMFNGATSFSSKNYDALLTGWSSLPSLQNNVDFGAPPTTYCRGKAGRDILENTYNWAITGDLGEDCPIPFVTTWNTEEGTGQTGNTTIVLPIVSGAYDVDINNDGTFEMTNQTGSTTIDFGTGNAGTHTIAVIPNPADINGQLRINHSATGSTPQKLTSIDKWGDIAWTSMLSAFYNCSNMTLADDAGAPDLTNVTNMSSTFQDASSFTGDLSSWNVSNVTNMSSTFSDAASFNSDLSSWNVSNVTNMSSTFSDAASFNSDLSSWNVSNCSNMSNTFSGTNFTGDLSSWNVSQVTDMTGMLSGANSFSRENYDALLTGWSSLQGLQSGVPFGAPPTTYCEQAGRDILTNAPNNWTITGDLGRSRDTSACGPPITYYGNGSTGPVGLGSLSFSHNGTTVSGTFNNLTSRFIFSGLVIYIDSKTGGFSTTRTFDDASTELAKAVSIYNGGSVRSIVNFPPGFTADYAIVIYLGVEGSSRLYELSGTGSHTSFGPVNLNPTTNYKSSTYTFNFDFSDIGTTSTDNFKFVAVYLGNPASLSDEAIGDRTERNSGQGIEATFAAAREYPIPHATWSGEAVDGTSWTDIENWIGSTAPSSTYNVYIPRVNNQPTATAAVTVNKVTMAPGASLIAESTFSGEIAYNREINFASGNQAGWYLMASPVVGETYDDAFITANDIAEGTTRSGITNRAIGTYNTSTSSWEYFQTGIGTTGSGTFVSGQGYTIKRGTSAGTIPFTGTLNTDNAGVNVVLSNSGNRFNLLGNPYTSYLNSTTFLNGEAAISEEKSLWVWNQEIGMYEAKNLVEPLTIAPGQGFFVKANTAGGTFNFSEANQSHNATDTFQKSKKTKIKLDITDGDIQRYCKIYYSPETTTGFDVGYDGELFGGAPNPFAIYTHLVSDSQGKHYQIQSLPYSDIENMVIPIGINAVSGKEITITADVTNFPAGVHLYLEDKLENSFTKLSKSGAKYTVTLSDNLEGIGRFFLRASSSDLGDDSSTSLENISVYTSSKNNLRIVGIQEGNVKLSAYNILGAQIINTSFKANGKNDVKIPNLATGIYIVHLEMATGKVSKKIVVE